jgi:hypothetical protein
VRSPARDDDALAQRELSCRRRSSRAAANVDRALHVLARGCLPTFESALAISMTRSALPREPRSCRALCR